MRRYGDAAIVEAAGCDAANRHHAAPASCCRSSQSIACLRRPRRASFARAAGVAPSGACWRTRRLPGHAFAPPRTSNLTLIPFQLEPALALVRGHGCRFLIADDVGLGKTVQAGLMIAEVACAPARRACAGRSRRRRFATVAPRAAARVSASTRTSSTPPALRASPPTSRRRSIPGRLPQIVMTSIDYIKRPEVMRSLETLTWDFVAFDEAHNLAGRSDRAAAAQAVGDGARVPWRSSRRRRIPATTRRSRGCAASATCARAYPLLIFRRTRADAGIAGRRRTT